MQRAIAEKLEASGPRAEALGKLQRQEAGSNATDRRGDVEEPPCQRTWAEAAARAEATRPRALNWQRGSWAATTTGPSKAVRSIGTCSAVVTLAERKAKGAGGPRGPG